MGARVSNSRTLEAETGRLLLGYTVSSKPDCTKNETLSQDNKQKEQKRGRDIASSVGRAFVKRAVARVQSPATLRKTGEVVQAWTPVLWRWRRKEKGSLSSTI